MSSSKDAQLLPELFAPGPLSSKPWLNVAFVGHCKHGKSTVAGQLIAQSGDYNEKQLEALQQPAEEAGMAYYKYAWLLDRGKKERDRQITMDVGVSHFETPAHNCTVLDTPGQKRFAKNMLTGAAQADMAVLVISAQAGEFEASIDINGVVYGYVLFLSRLGVKNLVVAVNKMDTAQYAEERFEEIATNVREYIQKYFDIKSVAFVPISGWLSENIDKPCDKMPWYKGWTVERHISGKVQKVSGMTLVEAIDSCTRPANEAAKRPLRVSVQQFFKVGGIGSVVIGRVEAGEIKRGMKLVAAPGTGDVLEVAHLQIHYRDITAAPAGQVVAINVRGISTKKLSRGMLLGEPGNPPRAPKSFVAKIRIEKHPLDRGDEGEEARRAYDIKRGYEPVIDIHTAHVTCKLTRIDYTFVRGKKKPHEKKDISPRVLKVGENAVVQFTPLRAVALELYKDYPALGMFVIRDLNSVVGYGQITEVEWDAPVDAR